MFLLQATVSLGMVIGSVSIYYLTKAVGNIYLLLIATTLVVIAYAFSVIYLRESLTGAVPVSNVVYVFLFIVFLCEG